MGGVDQLITLSTPTRVRVELGCVRLRLWLGCDNISIYGGGFGDLYFLFIFHLVRL